MMTWLFNYRPIVSEGDNLSVRSSISGYDLKIGHFRGGRQGGYQLGSGFFAQW